MHQLSATTDFCRRLIVGVLAWAAGAIASSAMASTETRQTVIIVRGAEGEPDFGRQFTQWSQRWQEAAKQADARLVQIGESVAQKSDKELVEEELAQEATVSTDTLWIVLIGHGTFDGKSAKFNLVGPDLAELELAKWLKPVSRPVVVMNCSSCSSPFLNALSGPNRVIVTSTRSGHERNFSRFGDYLSAAISDATADLDKDGQVSILEAYLSAGYHVNRFYEEQARLATEHPLLDDNGDSLGTPTDWFSGTRATKTAKDGAAVDGIRANQLCLIRSEQERQLPNEIRQRRDELELRLGQLRSAKSSMDEAEYYQKVEALALQLAELYEQVKPK
jgi:hypothetical protein